MDDLDDTYLLRSRYQLLVHRTAYLYILLAPFAMAEEMGWYLLQ